MHTVTKGDIATLRIAVALIERGEHVLRPMSENERYDLGLDRGGRLYRVQCKSGRYRNDCVLFNTCSTHAHRGQRTRDYVGQVEAFGVYCAELNKAFLVPIENVNGRALQSLRVGTAGRNNGRQILMAAQFEIVRT